jgi:hypothetical protein
MTVSLLPTTIDDPLSSDPSSSMTLFSSADQLLALDLLRDHPASEQQQAALMDHRRRKSFPGGDGSTMTAIMHWHRKMGGSAFVEPSRNNNKSLLVSWRDDDADARSSSWSSSSSSSSGDDDDDDTAFTGTKTPLHQDEHHDAVSSSSHNKIGALEALKRTQELLADAPLPASETTNRSPAAAAAVPTLKKKNRPTRSAPAIAHTEDHLRSYFDSLFEERLSTRSIVLTLEVDNPRSCGGAATTLILSPASSSTPSSSPSPFDRAVSSGNADTGLRVPRRSSIAGSCCSNSRWDAHPSPASSPRTRSTNNKKKTSDVTPTNNTTPPRSSSTKQRKVLRHAESAPIDMTPSSSSHAGAASSSDLLLHASPPPLPRRSRDKQVQFQQVPVQFIIDR